MTAIPVVVPVAAVLAVVVLDGHVLLVRRANPPDQGLWGLPGGRIETGETMLATAERELAEETGIAGRAGPLIEAFDLLDHAADGGLRHHYVVLVVGCTWISGIPTPGDDALEAAWFEVAALQEGDPGFSTRTARIARAAIRSA